MKNLITSIILVFSALFSHAQDVLYFNNGSETQVKVTEVSSTEVKYHRFDNLDGPVFVTPKSELFMIKYKNGSKEMMQASATNSPPAATEVVSSPKEQYTSAPAAERKPGAAVSAYLQNENKEKLELYKRKARNKTKTGIGFMIPGGVLLIAGAGITAASLNAERIDNTSALSDYYIIGAPMMGLGAVFVIVGGASFGWASKYRRMARELENGGTVQLSPSIINFDGHQGVGATKGYGLSLTYKF
jgi:hypothetical protein